ncbi:MULTISPECIES: hydrophobin family protein [unclassified Streptomyces]|uniref:hydrophobin family protein n=1 Tax=unclassified Streptomyces TaxID=2593676 RepID=UPI002DDC4978|nr:hydrophobin family protein [Streptomyces sp. NBC_01766]WSC24385.1 hydrophobin family protein [Streptomyces sp. NBC_01766]
MTTSRLAACATAIAALSIALGGTAHADTGTSSEFMTGHILNESGDSNAVTCQNNTTNGLVSIGCSPISVL